MPRVTVAISVYNGADTLRETLESALAQTYTDHEVLVLDDGSQDNSAQIAEELGCRVVRQENKGRGAALARLIQLAEGELVALLDADDLWTPDKLAKQVPFFDQSKAILTHTNGWFDYADRTEERLLDIPNNADSFDHILPNNKVIACSTLFRKADMLEAGNFHPDTWSACDWYGWFLLAARGPFALQSDKLVRYRIREGSIANRKLRFMEGKRHVLNDLILPRLDELLARLPNPERQRFAKLLRQEIGVTTSAIASNLPPERKSEVRPLHREALKLAPNVLRVWTRALRDLV